jgi:hypothetical protein
VPLRYLQRDGDGGEREGVDDTVITDPQHWAVRLEEYVEYIDSDGNVVEEGEIDWDTEGVPDAEPDEGLRHADSVKERPVFAPEWYCLNPEGAGLQVSEMYQRNAEWHARDRSGQSHTATTDLDSEASDADREAAPNPKGAAWWPARRGTHGIPWSARPGHRASGRSRLHRPDQGSRHRAQSADQLPPPGEQILSASSRDQDGHQPAGVGADHRQHR